MVSNMKYALLSGNTVDNVILADAEFAASIGAIECPNDAGIGWTWDGESFSPPVPPQKTPEEVQAEIVAATQERLDAFARTRNYDDIKSACGYAGCSVVKFDTEGSYCRDARAETWAVLYGLLGEVEAGTRPMPAGFAEIEPLLPALVWPN